MNEASQKTTNMSSQQKRELLTQLLHRAIHEGRSNLTPEQRRIWFLQQLNPTLPVHVCRAFNIYGALNVTLLQQSLDLLIAQHDILRGAFVDLEGYPVQLIMPVAHIEPVQVDLSQLSAEDQQIKLQQLAVQHIQQPMVLQSAPLLRITLARLRADYHVILIALHQIIADEASLTIMIRELAMRYSALAQGIHPRVEERTVSFAGLASRTFTESERGRLAHHVQAWRKKLTSLQPLQLPPDHPRPARKTYLGASRTRDLPVELVTALEALGQQFDASLTVILLTAFKVLLARYTHAYDIVVGMPVDGRHLLQHQQVVGPLTNILVLRTDLSGDPPFQQVLERVQGTYRHALAHDDVPFEMLVQELQPQRDLSSDPLFQIAFAERLTTEPIVTPTLHITPHPLETGTARYDVTLFIERNDQALRLAIEFNADLFEATTIECLLEQLQALLEGIVSNADQHLTALPLLTERTRQQVLVEWNQTRFSRSDERCIHERIADHAHHIPDAVAVIAQGRRMTFAELEERANQLAGTLRACGVGPERLVAVCLERSIDVPAVLLAILKAGGAYVPIDSAYPDERITFILRDTHAQVVVTQRHLHDRMLLLGQDAASTGGDIPSVICLDAGATATVPPALVTPEQSVTLDTLAYVMYTSGSTGKPKGVMITHGGLLNYLLWAVEAYKVVEGNGTPLATSLSFDLTVTSLFTPLLAGRPVTVLPEQVGPEMLGEEMAGQPEHYSVVKITPAHMEILNQQIPVQKAASCTRFFVIGGEQVYFNTLNFWRTHATATTLINEYGPTETVVGCCTYQVRTDDPEEGPVPIGRPIANTQLYVLDERMQPVPIGVSGELYIGGAGVARGYLARPGLTAERFVPNPFTDVPGARFYRTGDIARYRADGTLEFLGRLDRQVKVRGFRIELGEIESMLLEHPQIAQAIVEALPDSNGDRRLVAYVVAQQKTAPSREDIVAFLATRLPHFMVPHWVVAQEQFPQTVNGKIDRKALPPPETLAEPEHLVEVETPRTSLEKEIAQIVTQMLGVTSIGINESIFTYGASSLMVARLSARLSSLYNIDRSIHEMFEEPTIAGFARMVSHFRALSEDPSLNEDPSLGGWRWEAERLDAEAALDSTITPEGLPTSNYLDPANVFLTGVTGYLGAFLLDALLRRTHAVVYCLVRANNVESAMRRIQRNLQHFRTWKDSYAQRIRPVCGDLGKPLLGLSSETFAALATTIDAIYHPGALVNFSYPYDALRIPNVQGTQEVLRLACHTTRKAVHYLSTLDVFLMTSAPRPFLEVDLPRQPVTVPDGYMRTKWVGEKLMTAARERGLPITIHRPGFLIGHTETGACPPYNYLVVALKGFLQLGVLPQLNEILNITPVDYAADAIVYLAGRPDTYGKHFHLWNLAPLPMEEAYPWIRSFGYNFDVVPYREAHRLAQQVPQDHPLYPIIPLLALNDEFDDTVETSSSSLLPSVQATIDLDAECANVLAGLKGSGITCPPMNEEMIHRCLAYLVDTGFLPPPSKGSV